LASSDKRAVLDPLPQLQAAQKEPIPSAKTPMITATCLR